MSRERESNPSFNKGDGFVWPPRTMVDVPVRRGSEPSSERPRSRSQRIDHIAPSTRERLAHDGTRWPSILAAIEDMWLDTTRPALWRRLVNATDEQNGLSDNAICRGCGRERVNESSGGATCGFCRRARPAWSQFVRVGPYRGPLRDAIRELKFERDRAAGAHLGRLLGARLAARILELDRNCQLRRVILTPIPTTRWRRLTRGIDHARALTRSVARQLRSDLARAGHSTEVEMGDLLARRGRKSQTQVAASARRRNVAGAFTARGLSWNRHQTARRPASTAETGSHERRIYSSIGRLWRGTRHALSPWARVLSPRGEARAGTLIIGVDDISTTGATMHQAIRVLERSIGSRAVRDGRVRLWAAAVAVTGARDSDK